MARVILYKGKTNYGALRLHADYLAEAFRILGHEAIIVDLNEPDAAQFLLDTLRKPTDAILAFNAMAANIAGSANQSLYDQLQVPFFILCVDHPSTHIPRFNFDIKNLAITCLDQSHIQWCLDYYGKEKFQLLSFFIPGGSQSLNHQMEQSYEEYLAKRTIPVLFTGSFAGIPQRKWGQYSPKIISLLNDVADFILSGNKISIEEGFHTVLTAKNIFLSTELNQKMGLFTHLVHRYIHNQRRFLLFKTLGEHEIPVTIYGKGWLPYAQQWPSFTVHEEGTMAETLDNLHKARLVLNSNTHFVNGGHERVFNAMINGAAVFSDSSTYYEQEFAPGKNIILFDWDKLQEVPHQIRHLINHPEETWQVAQAAYTNVLQNHTWLHRAEQLLELIELRHSLLRMNIKDD